MVIFDVNKIADKIETYHARIKQNNIAILNATKLNNCNNMNGDRGR